MTSRTVPSSSATSDWVAPSVNDRLLSAARSIRYAASRVVTLWVVTRSMRAIEFANANSQACEESVCEARIAGDHRVKCILVEHEAAHA